LEQHKLPKKYTFVCASDVHHQQSHLYRLIYFHKFQHGSFFLVALLCGGRLGRGEGVGKGGDENVLSLIQNNFETRKFSHFLHFLMISGFAQGKI